MGSMWPPTERAHFSKLTRVWPRHCWRMGIVLVIFCPSVQTPPQQYGRRTYSRVSMGDYFPTKLTAASGRVLNGPANAVHTVAWPASSMSWKRYHPAPPEGVKSRADPTFGHSRTRLKTFTIIIRYLNPARATSTAPRALITRRWGQLSSFKRARRAPATLPATLTAAAGAAPGKGADLHDSAL